MTDTKQKQPPLKVAKIKITKNGPYEVTGVRINEQFIMPDENGASSEYRDGQTFATGNETETIALCRCGRSKNPPFCDGSHEHAFFDGQTTAPHEKIMDNAKLYEGENYTLADNEAYCAFARFCDALGRVWNRIEQGPASEEVAVKLAHKCPAGRLMIVDNKTGQQIEPDLEPEISILQDPAIGVSGPIYVKGGIVVEDENGNTYEGRQRQTLCRCGYSSNKPFCDGSHASIRFSDGQIKPRRR